MTAELVLAIPRDELTKQYVGINGIYDFDLDLVGPDSYAFIARNVADNKSLHSVMFGMLLPQVLPYFIVTDSEGNLLTYERKGQEKGLVGKRSIGIGGHVSMDDAYLPQTPDVVALGLPAKFETLQQIVQSGLYREVFEEIGIRLLDTVKFDYIISSHVDPVNQVHIALVAKIEVDNFDELKYDSNEFLNVQYWKPEEIKASAGFDNYENWSKLIINKILDK